MDKDQLRELIEETLRQIGLYSKDATELIMLTIAQESRLGHFVKQLGNGPALGIAQMEPATFKDHTDHYLRYKQDIKEAIMKACNLMKWEDKALVYNLKFSISMCRVHYLRNSEPLPVHTNISKMAEYWKKYYNTHLGAGTVEEAINNYQKYAL